MAGEVTTGELIAFVGSSLPEVSKNPPIAAINTPAPPKIMALLPLDFELSFFVSLFTIDALTDSTCAIPTSSFLGSADGTGGGVVKTASAPLEFEVVLTGGGTRLAKGVGVEPKVTFGGILVPHLMQNLAFSRTSAAQFGHFLDIKKSFSILCLMLTFIHNKSPSKPNKTQAG